ncbi:MAG: aminotransferase class V-fold PLP-dependent enzyme [Thermoleophilia bacterium]
MPPDLGAVRAQLPALAAETYLNTGGAGPLPRVAAEAMAEAAHRDAALGRMSMAAWAQSDALMTAARAAAGRVLGAPAEDMALVMNTSVGMNIAIWGIHWRPGDHIVCTGLEHPGLSVPVATIARRLHLQVDWVDAEAAHTDLEGAVARLVRPTTRLVGLSHVAWSTGAVLDVAGAARAAHRVGAVCAVDAAQSAGAIPCDPAALGVDAYAVPGQKWLLGPEGVGALWVSPEARERIDLSHTGFDAGTGHTPAGAVALHPGTRRYETSTMPMVCLAGWVAALDWMEGLGWDWIHRRTAEVHAMARRALEGIDGVEIITPPGPQAGLLSFDVPGIDAEAACVAMAARGVICRWLPSPRVLRASLGFFSNEDDIDALARAVADLRS